MTRASVRLQSKLCPIIGPRHPPLYSEQVVFNIVDLCNIHVAANETKTWFDQHKGTDDAFLVGLYALRPEGPVSWGVRPWLSISISNWQKPVYKWVDFGLAAIARTYCCA